MQETQTFFSRCASLFRRGKGAFAALVLCPGLEGSYCLHVQMDHTNVQKSLKEIRQYKYLSARHVLETGVTAGEFLMEYLHTQLACKKPRTKRIKPPKKEKFAQDHTEPLQAKVDCQTKRAQAQAKHQAAKKRRFATMDAAKRKVLQAKKQAAKKRRLAALTPEVRAAAERRKRERKKARKKQCLLAHSVVKKTQIDARALSVPEASS